MIDFDEDFSEFSFNEKIANISLIHLESMQTDDNNFYSR